MPDQAVLTSSVQLVVDQLQSGHPQADLGATVGKAINMDCKLTPHNVLRCTGPTKRGNDAFKDPYMTNWIDTFNSELVPATPTWTSPDKVSVGCLDLFSGHVLIRQLSPTFFAVTYLYDDPFAPLGNLFDPPYAQINLIVGPATLTPCREAPSFSYVHFAD